MGSRMVGLFCFLWLLMIGRPVLAQDFSADVANTRSNDKIRKVYSTKDKARFEVQAENQTMGPVAVIADDAQKRWLMLLTDRHMYVEQWPTIMKRPTIIQFWHVENVNDACPQWKKVAEQAGTYQNWGSCAKVGGDTVSGRSTVKYEGVSKDGKKNHYWVDTKLHCVIKTDEDTGGGIELTNIKEEPQPASLFEIPAGYTKVDLASMMGQMRQR